MTTSDDFFTRARELRDELDRLDLNRRDLPADAIAQLAEIADRRRSIEAELAELRRRARLVEAAGSAED